MSQRRLSQVVLRHINSVKEPSLMLLGNSGNISLRNWEKFYRAKLLRQGKHMKGNIRKSFKLEKVF